MHSVGILQLCVGKLQLFVSPTIFTRESSYWFQRVLAIAILSVCLSHRWIN